MNSEIEKPPRGMRTMSIVRWVILALAALVAAGSWLTLAHADHSAEHGTKYQCPMHPQIVSDAPGECPICHMTLVPVAADRLQKPEAPAASANSPNGTQPITLSLDRMQAIGVRTAIAEERRSAPAVRVSANVALPEQTVAEVHVRAPGFVESIAVRESGIRVKKGQNLLSVYSPDVYQAQAELLATKDWANPVGARTKLSLLGVSAKVADRVMAQGKPIRAVGISAPIAGFITKKNVVLGSYVTPEMALFEIVDLSHVYVIAEVYQRYLSDVGVGTQAKFFPASRKDLGVDAKVDLIYPAANVEARTVRVRMQIENEKLGLLPGEYGFVELERRAEKAIFVPRDSVVDTGKQTYVFIDEGQGKLTPRLVELGAESENSLEIRSGVAAGERVISGATFLVDSESRLQGSINPSSREGAQP